MLDTGSMAFMMLSGALVLFMTPGVAFFYGGMVDEGGVVTIMMQSFVAMGLVSLWWFSVGFSLCFGDSLGVIGNPGTYPALVNVSPKNNLVIAGVPVDQISGMVYCMYQLTFAIITPALMTGGFAERLRFKPYVIFILLWATLVYAPFAHLAWGGGLFYKWGVFDFAGGTVVHITSGWGALGALLVVGKRHREEDAEEKPHNVPFILLGTAILWFGWFGFNGGSALQASATASAAYLNSQLSAASALWSWLLIDWLYKGKPSLVGACVGAVAGLVGITPCAGFVQPWAALVTGFLVTVVCQITCEVRRIFLARWLDDALDVWGTHGVGGLCGAILVGALSDPSTCQDATSAPDWCVSPGTVTRSWDQVRKQTAAAFICCGYSIAVTFLILKALGLFLELKPKHHDAKASIDEHEHAEAAYHSPTKVFSGV